MLADWGGARAGPPLGAMAATLRLYWTEAEGYQRFLYVAGALMVVSAVFHAGVLVVAGGSLEGPVSWRKPISFGVGFGLTALTVGWFMTYLSKRRVLGWALSLIMLLSMLTVPSSLKMAPPSPPAVLPLMVLP